MTPPVDYTDKRIAARIIWDAMLAVAESEAVELAEMPQAPAEPIDSGAKIVNMF